MPRNVNRPSGGGRFGRAPALLEHTAPGRVAGSFEIYGPTLPNQASAGETLMCAHDGTHWTIKPGSGIVRGFCLNCNGPTCGKQACETHCIPYEKQIEMMESAGRGLDLRGAVIFTRRH